MLSKSIVESLKARYAELHPLLFHRSRERAKSDGDLFDILDTVPTKYPLVWCENNQDNKSAGRWVHVKDLYLTEDFFQDKNNETI